jgi:hypothetical protein
VVYLYDVTEAAAMTPRPEEFVPAMTTPLFHSGSATPGTRPA